MLYKTLFLTAGLVAPHTELTTPTALAETPNFVPTVILSYYTVCSISNFESVPTKLFLHRQTMNELHQTKDGGM